MTVPAVRSALMWFLLGTLALSPSWAQTVPLPAPQDTSLVAGRPLPGPVYENPDFSRAVLNGTRTRTGMPGPRNWVQHARYDISAALDVTTSRVTGQERVTYLNHSPDTLRQVAVYLRQNLFAPGSPRREPVPITGGVTLTRVAADGQVLDTLSRARRRGPGAGAAPAGYRVNGTMMQIRLPRALLPGDSAQFEFGWSYVPAPSPSDGREGREDHLYFMGYWYPQIAVYDDVSGWVTDPYLNGAEFYMDPADYDVRVTVPHGWVVGATGTLANRRRVLSARTRERLAAARRSRNVVHVIAADDRGHGGGFAAGGPTATWHYTATNVRDFAWGTSDRYAWDATIALVRDSARGRTDTVAINSYYRLSDSAAAWAQGGARYTRDAIEQLSAYLWPYPWPTMSSMEGILLSGGMEYPMMTLMQPWADTLSLAGDLMHETGHMWFPMQVGSNETRHPWMDEGLTQFDVAQAMRVLYGEPRQGGRPNDSEQGQRGRYVRTAREGRDQGLMQWGDLFPLELYSMYYDKTSQALIALRGVLGDELFHRTLREYGHRWLGRHPEARGFLQHLRPGGRPQPLLVLADLVLPAVAARPGDRLRARRGRLGRDHDRGPRHGADARPPRDHAGGRDGRARRAAGGCVAQRRADRGGARGPRAGNSASRDRSGAGLPRYRSEQSGMGPALAPAGRQVLHQIPVQQ